MSAKALNDKALEEYYSALFVTYSTDGWKKLMEDCNRMLETHDKLAGIETAEQLWFRKGQIDQMAHLLNHQNAAEISYDALLSEQEGEEVSTATGGVAKVVS